MIGAEGGVLQTSRGVFVSVPAGAVALPVTFFYRPLSDARQSAGANRVVTSSFELTALDGLGSPVTQFALPLLVGAPYTITPDTGRLALAYQDPATGDWIELPGRKVDGETRTVRAQTDHFTAFGVTETFETNAIANNRILFTDPLANFNNWVLQSGTAASLDATLGDGTGLWDFNAAIYTVENSDNYGQNFTYRAAIQNQNEAGGSGDQFGGIVFGYQSAANHWRLMKSQKKDFSNTDPPLVLVQCTGSPCGPVTWTGYTAPNATFTCTNCTVRAYSVNAYDPGPGDNIWIEVTLSVSGANTLITGRAYADAGGCGGTTPCQKSAAAQESVTFTASSAQYDHGAIGLIAQTAGQWAIAKPQAEGTLPADASGSWTTCMHRTQPLFSTASGCAGNPGVIWDAETVRTGSTKTIQVYSGDAANTGSAYQQFSLGAAGNYGIRAFIRPNAAAPANNARVQVCTTGAATSAACSGATLLAETGPGVAFSSSQECTGPDAEGWYDCQASFSVAAAQNVHVRLTLTGVAGTANFDNVIISSIPNSPTITIDGASGDNKSVYGTPDDHTAGGNVDLRVYGTTPTNGGCAACTVKVYDTVSGVTTLIATYTDAQYYSLVGGSAATQHQPAAGGSPPVTHNYTAVYVDASGIRSFPASATPFQIDTTPPTIGVAVAPAANAFGWNNANVTATFTCSDVDTGIAASGCAGSAGAGSGTPNAAATGAGVNATGTYTLTAETTAAGIVITGTATDRGGNTATVSTAAIRIDKTAPTAASAIAGTLGLNGWYTSTITVTWTCSDALSGMSFTPTGVAGCDVSGATTNTDGTNSATGVISVDTAGTVVNVLATDQAGNSATVSTAALGRDTGGPSSVVTAVGGAAPSSSFNASTYANLTTSGFAGTASDTVSGIADGSDTNASQAMRIALTRLGGGTPQYWNWTTKQWVAGALPALPATPAASAAWLDRTATFGAGTTWTWTVPTANVPLANTTTVNGWPEDTYTVTAYAQDSAGNVQAAAATGTFTVDATPPTGTIAVNCLPAVPGANCVGGVKYVNTTTIPLTLTATDGVNVDSYVLGQSGPGGTAAAAQAAATAARNTAAEVDVANTTAYTNTAATFALTAAAAPGGDGAYHVAVQYQDTAVNWCCGAPEGAAPLTDSVVLDRTAPVVNITSPATGTVFGAGAMAIQVQVSDALSGIGVAPTVTVDQAGPGGPTAATLTGCAPALPQFGVAVTCSYSYTVTAGAATDGTATISVSVQDQALNSATDSDTFIVDTQPPTISVVATKVVAGGAAYAAGSWTNADVVLVFTCGDSGTGIAANGCAGAGTGSGTAGGPGAGGASVTGTWTVTAETTAAGVIITGTATDQAGNTATVTFGPILIDKTLPDMTYTSISAPDGLNGWWVSPVVISFTCADPVNAGTGAAGSGMRATPDGCVPTGTAPSVNVTGDFSGTTTINVDGIISTTGSAFDVAGNQRDVTVPPGIYKLDQTRPDTVISTVGNVAAGTSPSFNAATYTDLTTFGFTGTASDATSGIADGADTNASQAIRVALTRPGFYWNWTTKQWVAGALPALPATPAASAAWLDRTATFGAGTTWTWTVPTANVPLASTSTTNGWPEATYTVTAYAQDEAGWVDSTAATGTFTVDATAPAGTISVNCLPAVPGANCVGGVKYVNTTTIPLTLTATDGVNVDSYVLGQSGPGGTAADAQTHATGRRNTAAEVDVANTTSYTNAAATFALTAAAAPGGDGTYHVAVQYQDAAGNWCCGAPEGAAPVSDSVVLDRVAPVVNITSPATGTVFGAGAMAIQVQVSDALSGIGVAPTVTVQQTGAGAPTAATLTGCAPALPQFGVAVTCSYSYTVTAAVGTDGTATISVSVQDQALNSAADTDTFIVDTQPPTISVAAHTVSAVGPAYAANVWTNQDVVLVFTCNDSGTGIATNGCAGLGASGSSAPSGNGGPGAGGVAVTGTWTVTAETTAAGVTITGTATDKAGNIATVTFGPILIDKTLPDMTYTPIAGPDGLNGWWVSPVVINFTCSDPVNAGTGAAGSGMRTTPDGCVPTGTAPSVNVTGDFSGSTTITTDGVAATTGSAFDIAGNQRDVTVPPGTYKLDQARPDAAIATVGSVAASPSPSFNASTYANLSTFGFVGTATDATSGIADGADTNAADGVRVALRRASDGAYWNFAGAWVVGPAISYAAPHAFNAGTTWDWSVAGAVLPSGTAAANGWTETSYTLTVTAQDEAGWTDLTPATAAFTVDATAPTGTIAVNCLPTAPGANCVGGVKYVNTTTIPLTLAATDGVNVDSYVLGQSGLGGTAVDAQTHATGRRNTAAEVDVANTTAYTNTAATFALTAAAAPGGDGAYHVAVQYQDAAGNWCCGAPEGAAPLTDSVVLDRVVPVVNITSPATGTVFGAGAMAIQVQVSDTLSGIGVAPTVTVQQTGAGAPTTATLTGCAPALPQVNVAVTCSYTYTVTAAVGTDGTATISVAARDQALNSAADTDTFIVDTQPPTISVAAYKTVAGGAAYAAGSWTNADVVLVFTCGDSGTGIAANGCAGAGTGSGTAGGPGAGGASVTGTWTVTAETTAAGVTITGTATDQAGNTATVTFGPILIDKTLPTMTFTGINAPDGENGWWKTSVTIDFTCADPVNAGTGAAGSGMRATPDGCVPTGTAPATNTTGDFTGQTVIITDGIAATTGTAFDIAGNQTNVTVPPGTYKLDRTAPESAISTIGNLVAGISPSFNAATYTDLTTFGFVGTATDATSGIADGADTNAADGVLITLRRASDGAYWNFAGAWVVGPAIAYSAPHAFNAGTSWDWTVAGAVLPSGTAAGNGWLETTYTLTSLAEDEAGHVEAAPATATFTVDATPPTGTLAVNCPPAAPGAAACVGGVKYVKTTSVPMTLTATDGVNVDSYVLGQSVLGGTAADAQTNAVSRRDTAAEVNIGNTAAYTNAAATYTLTAAAAPAGDGAYWVAVNYQDVAVNWCCGAPAAPVADQVVLDRVAPSAAVTSPAVGTRFTAGAMTITIDIADATSGIGAVPTLRVKQAGAAPAVDVTASGVCAPALPQVGVTVTCTYTYTVTAGAGTDGTATITVETDDRATNRTTTTSTFLVDTQPPTIGAAARKSPSNATYTAGTWSNEDVVVTFTCADAVAMAAAPNGCTVNPAPGIGTGPTGTLTTTAVWTFDVETAGQNVTGQARDAAGNVVTVTFGPVRVDKTKPSSAITSPVHLNLYTGPGFPSITGTAADALSGVASVGITIQRLDNNQYWSGASWGLLPTYLATDTFNAGTGAWDRTAGLPSGAQLAEGDYRVCSRATDNANNVEVPAVPVSCVQLTINQRPHVTSTTPTGGAILPRSHASFQITLNEKIYKCANPGVDPCTSTLDGLVAATGADYGTLFAVRDPFGVALAGTATVDATGKVVTVTLNPNCLLPGCGPLSENTTYTIEVQGCAAAGCKTGVLDDRGGSLGDSAGVLLALDARPVQTPDPVNLPVSSTVSWNGPAAGPIKSMTPARRDVAAGAYGSKFVVTGGLAADNRTILGTTQVYNAATNTWATGAAMATARYAHASAVSGTLMYVFGGVTAAGTVRDTLAYNVANNTWSTGHTSLPAARRYAAAAAVDGTVYVAGGIDAAGFPQNTMWAYNPGTKAWTTLAAIPGDPRARLTLTATGTGAGARLWAIGGTGDNQGVRVDVYDPNTNSWSAAPNLPAARSLHGIATLNDYIYVIGGVDGANVTQTTVYVYDPLLGTGGAWQAANAASLLPEGRAAFGGHVAVFDASATPGISGILVAGGRTASAPATASMVASQHQ